MAMHWPSPGLPRSRVNLMLAEQYRQKAAEIKQLVQDRLWNSDAQFFKTLPRGEGKTLADVREAGRLRAVVLPLARSGATNQPGNN